MNRQTEGSKLDGGVVDLLMQRKPSQAVEKAAHVIAPSGSAWFRPNWISTIRMKITGR